MKTVWYGWLWEIENKTKYDKAEERARPNTLHVTAQKQTTFKIRNELSQLTLQTIVNMMTKQVEWLTVNFTELEKNTTSL